MIEAKIEGENGEASEAGQAKLLAEKVMLLSEALENNQDPVMLDLSHRFCTQDHLARLKRIIEEHKGSTPVQLRLRLDESVATLTFGNGFKVAPDTVFWEKIEQWQEARQ